VNLRRLVFWITILGVFAMAARISVDTDTWWHLRAGQWMLENRAVPQVDPFSYTRLGQPWQYPGWIVQLPMILIYRAGGPGGLNLWTALMVALTFTFVWHTLEGGPFLRAFVIILAAAVSGVYWAARPYLVTFLLSAVFLYLLETRTRRPAPPGAEQAGLGGAGALWLLPLLMILWANSHGGFAVGFLLWGIYWLSDWLGALLGGELPARLRLLRQPRAALGDAGWRLTWIGLLMVLAVCLNPSGPLMLLYPFKTVSIGALQDYIQEWQSPDFHSRNVQPFIWMLLLTFGAVGASRRRLALTDFLLVAGFAYLGLLAGRNVALFALAAAPALARHASAALGQWGRLARRWPLFAAAARPSAAPAAPGRAARLVNLLILALLAFAVLVKALSVYPAAVNQAAFEKILPLDAVAYLRQAQPAGRIFNAYNWGGYLLWALPEYPVFIDGRTDLYNDEIISQWLQVVRGEDGWQQRLAEWQVRLVLLEPGMPLVGQLEQAGWRLLYEDEQAVVYGR
jgi:hypothetical protein